MARVNTFSGRGGVLHGGDGGAEPPRGPSRGLPQPEDAPPIFQEEEPDQGYQGSVSLEELLGDIQGPGVRSRRHFRRA